MRIATYNVNGIDGRLGNLLGWLDQTAPDIAFNPSKGRNALRLSAVP